MIWYILCTQAAGNSEFYTFECVACFFFLFKFIIYKRYYTSQLIESFCLFFNLYTFGGKYICVFFFFWFEQEAQKKKKMYDLYSDNRFQPIIMEEIMNRFIFNI
jgi:hypothetical protein